MSNNATKIDLYLKNPDGNPRTNSRVIVKPIRAGFWSTYVGLVEDTETVYQTDNNGYVQMTLWPLPYPYYLTYSDDDDAIPGQFLFYVPAVDTVVDFQDLIVTKADSADKYADTVLEQIIAAKVATMAAASEAKTSETNAANSASSAAASAASATTDAATTTSDRNQVENTNTNLLEIYSKVSSAIVRLQSFALTEVMQLGNFYIWADSTGVLRIGSAMPTDKDTEGTVVGTQS